MKFLSFVVLALVLIGSVGCCGSDPALQIRNPLAIVESPNVVPVQYGIAQRQPVTYATVPMQTYAAPQAVCAPPQAYYTAPAPAPVLQYQALPAAGPCE